MKLAMIKVHDWVHKKYTQDDVKLLLQVHDELVCEIRKDLVKELCGKIKEIMESVYKLAVPLMVDAKRGENWQEVEVVENN
jgi:DNA polymerase-1